MFEPRQEVSRVAGYFKVLSDHSRIHILTVLLNDECCVNDLAASLGISKSAVSHQLRILRSECLVKSRRVGKQIFYSISDAYVQGTLIAGEEHIHRRFGNGENRDE
ncbi:MAG: metalloregulator ArsR/SmtB family transcription factor [Oscillospiraceae bacterium]|nr:metalloregulator ArsR/SmtB family transcription factor [Oscillospiraceae bacterium]